jgi:hypothetical protein
MQDNNKPQDTFKPSYVPPVTQNYSSATTMKPIKSGNNKITLIAAGLFAITAIIGLLIFGLSSFSKMNKYKNNVDSIVASAVSAATQAQKASDDTNYQTLAKSPNKTYSAPAAAGSLKLLYPKTWSAYIVESETAANPVDGYFYPNFVPDITNSNNAFSLRIQVMNSSYATTIDQYTSQVAGGKITIAPYSLKNVPSVTGSMITGEIEPTKTGTMVLLPLRDKTIKVWTENSNALVDLNSTILPNLSFTP